MSLCLEFPAPWPLFQVLSRRTKILEGVSKTNVANQNSSGTSDVNEVGVIPFTNSKSLACPLFSRARSDRCTEKISLAVSWMICTQNNALKNYFDQRRAASGVFFCLLGSSWPAWDSAVARPCPSDPPISAARHTRDLHSPCLPRVYSRPNETPQSPRPGRVLREVGCNGYSQGT
jgi:hypothetical protein